MGYGPEAVAKLGYIINAVAEGLSLAKACKANDLSVSTFNEALAGEKKWAVAYARAREIRADIEVDEALEIADDLSLDPQQAKNRIDIRKWRAGKHKGSVYGDRIDLNVQQNISIVDALTDARSRVLPMRDLAILDAELIPTLSTNNADHPTDSVSDAAEQQASEPDIFS